MAVARGGAREALAQEVVLRRIEIAASQPGVREGYILDPKLADVVKRLPGYLQPVVALMAMMVPPDEERRLWEKRGSGGIGPRHQHSPPSKCSFSSLFC